MSTDEQKPVSRPVTRAELREQRRTARRVYLDPSSPSVRSIVRVVVITLLLLLLASFVESVLSALKNFFFLIVLSIFFAYFIEPLVRTIRRPFRETVYDRWMPRPLAIVIAYLIVFVVFGITISSIAPRAIDQAKEFAVNLPGFADAFRERAADLSRRFENLRVPEEVQAEMNHKMTELGSGITGWLGNFVLMSVTYLPWFLLVPILAFFFLKDVNLFRLIALRMFPAGRWRSRAAVVIDEVNSTLAAYTRAQLLSCVIIAIICSIGFSIIGIRYALLLGILAGIFEFVPLLGPLTIGIVVTLTAAASDNPWKALYVAIFLIVLRIVHDYFTYPRIVRGGLHLHPLAIILSVLAGEQVAGIPGVFLSIPIVAIATVIYRHVLEHHGQSGLVSGLIGEETVQTEETT